MKATILLLVAFAFFGCANNQAFERNSSAANTASQILQILDREVAPRYQKAAELALETLPAGATFPDYQKSMVRWDQIETGLRTAHSALLAMQSALQAWDDGSQVAEADYGKALACTVSGLQNVAEAAESLGVELPPEVGQFLTFSESILGPSMLTASEGEDCHGR
jgi:hypothetical protein